MNKNSILVLGLMLVLVPWMILDRRINKVDGI